ncbi:hypothetical protein DFJ63DRAFT_418 [Scheffersomyces coipomensis]|uniref:uncharacterized protein n=1 Tax=Scheffersomyces coipomensis TaxID=1788519 RepID=UPI00315D73E6
MLRKISQTELSPLGSSSSPPPLPPAYGTPALTPFYLSDRHAQTPFPPITDNYSATGYVTKTEKLANFKRFAKVCSSKWVDMISSTAANEEGIIRNTLKSSVYGGDKTSLFGFDHRKIQQIEKNYQEEKLKLKPSVNDFSIHNDIDKNKDQIRKQNTLRAKSSSNIGNDITVFNFKKKMKSNVGLSNRKSLESFRTKRVIVIRNLPSYTSANAILSQIRGGPLERIVFRTGNQSTSNSKSNTTTNSIELYFVFPDNARRFFHYSNNTGLFLINGIRPTIEWANKTNTEYLDEVHPNLSKNFQQDIVHGGCRRTLIFAKVIETKIPCKNGKPDAYTHFSHGLDIENIKHDFSLFGEIIDVCAVISRKLCFSLHFTDIRSAINAKRECELEGSDFNRKYSHWIICYGKDITDLPCFVV